MIDPLGGPAYLWPFAIAFIVGYLIGSVPFGLILTRFAGAGDVREIGSGNIGATNVLRTGRKGLAIATLMADLLKGFLPTLLVFAWFGVDMALITALGTVVGHCFPIWLRFRGGKGVATATGVILALTPVIMLPLVAIFAGVLYTTRFVSLASLVVAILSPIAAWVTGNAQIAELYIALAGLITFKHRENIVRLFKGVENKFDLKKRG